MPVSSSSLFHFTKNVNVLCQIIVHGYMAQYAKEPFMKLFFDEVPGKSLDMGVPMVCFCDIPLSQTKNHKEKYGDYCIGMTKEWAISNKVHPIIYAYKTGRIVEILKKLADKDRLQTGEVSVLDLFFYLKPLNSDEEISILGSSSEFYNEKEWRYVPNTKEESTISYIKEISQINILKMNQRILAEKNPCLQLKFEIEDISHIIVKSKSEVDQMVEFIRTLTGREWSSNRKDQLLAKLNSFDKISSDY